MATDTDHLFRALADDAGRARLEPSADLRRRSDRRTAVGTAVGAVAVVAAVAVVIVGGGALGVDSTRNLTPVDPVTPTVTTTTTTTTTPTPVTEIPVAAWLDTEDLRSGEPMARGDLEDLPALCGQRLLPPGFEPGSMTAVGVRRGTYLAPGLPADFVPNGTISQAVAVFDDEEGAARLMQWVQQAVSVCPEDATTDLRYELADPALPLSSARPDQHLLIAVDEPGVDFGDGAPNPPRIGTYISVVRVRDTVTLLTLRGWEGTETDLVDVQRLASRAIVRLLDWRAEA